MKIVILSGGLGNQMSQYAFYLAQKSYGKADFSTYSLRRKRKQHNGYELDNVFGISENISLKKDLFVRLMRKLIIFKNKSFYKYPVAVILFLFSCIRIKVVIENSEYRFEKKYLSPYRGIIVYGGGWHSEKYYFNQEQQIRTAYRFNLEKLNELSKNITEQIGKTNSIAIHIRRGDYFLSDYHRKTYSDICTLDYYQKAIDLFSEKIEAPVFYIFSDDIKWVKENMEIPSAVFIEHNVKEDSWQDMYLMTQCQHHIIANSTFSWWGAWLCGNEKKIVVCPSRFWRKSETPDFFPKNWIRL
jgi:hypothetical protein